MKSVGHSGLMRAAEQITGAYRDGRFGSMLRTPESRVAYLLTRLPATFAANEYVFREMDRSFPDLSPRDLLDLGTGPGTAMWAARETWPTVERATLFEANRDLLHLGQQLALDVAGIQWISADLSAPREFPVHDLVVLSYVLGELRSPQDVVAKAWSATRKALVIVEPGTPRNFAAVAAIRTQLLESGAYPLAPCPHTNECPMVVAGDWCHFAVRLARTSEHRQLKSGALGYEDEKFSYLAFSKERDPTPPARIVRHPAIHGGHIRLTLCTADGLHTPTVSRSDKPLFRAARKAEWGDAWPWPSIREDGIL